MLQAQYAVMASLFLFAAVLAVNPGMAQPALPGLVNVAWVLETSFAAVLGALALPSALSISFAVGKASMRAAKDEYWKMAIGYVLAFVSFILVTIYNTVLPEVQYLAVFVIVFASALFCDAIFSFARRFKSTFFIRAALVLPPLSWAIIVFSGGELLKAVLVGTKFVYLGFMAAAVAILYFDIRRVGAVLMTKDYRTSLVDAVLFAMAAGTILALSETILAEYALPLSGVRALLLCGSLAFFYESCREFHSVLKPFVQIVG